MSMQSSWVEALFTRLTVRYGRAFMAQYEGLDLDLIKSDWADALDGVTPDRIRFALEHLPADRPPNALQFRSLCREMRPASTGQLAALSLDRNPVPPTAEQQEALRRVRDDLSRYRLYRTPEPADLRREPLDLRREPIDMSQRTEAA